MPIADHEQAAMAGSRADSTHSARERRGAPRHATDFPVLLGRSGSEPATATLINLSETGAVVRLHEPSAPGGSAWPFHLAKGDKLRLSGLLVSSLTCWVVQVDIRLLRVQFWRDDVVSAQLRALMGNWLQAGA